MKIIRKIRDIKAADGGADLYSDAGIVRVRFLTPEIIRIRVSFDGSFRECSYNLMMTAWEDETDAVFGELRKHRSYAETDVKSEENQTVIQSESLKLVADHDPFGIRIYDLNGNLYHRDLPEYGYRLDNNLRASHDVCMDEKADHYYGFGEKTGHLDKKGQVLSMAPSDAMGYDPDNTDSLYKHIPFYIRVNENTRKAAGYYYHGSSPCEFNMGRFRSNYYPRTVRYRNDASMIDLFFIAGPSVREVIERYTDLTGKGVMLPGYALGYLGSSMYYAELEKDCDEGILHFTEIAKKEGMPVSDFHLSSGYCAVETEEGLKRCTFTWNQERFKDPAGFIAKMEENGAPVTANIKPGFLACHPYINEMKEQGLFLKDGNGDPALCDWWGGKGYLVDFTDPETRKKWKEYMKEHLLSYGVRSIWNDNCEYDSVIDEDVQAHGEGKGRPVSEVRYDMANLMCLCALQALKETDPDRRPYVVCRAGSAGIQQYAQTWAGDNRTGWDTLKYNIATILGMGLSGVAEHGCDIGGFYGPAPEPELLLRWIQNGILQPRFSIHSANTDHTVTEPWMYPEVKPYIKEAMDLRRQLFPYLYSLMYRAHIKGLPVMEAFVSAYPDDPQSWKEDTQFMLGDVLAANVLEKGQNVKEIRFPAGYDYYRLGSFEKYEGGKTVSLPVGLKDIPLFLRSGGILTTEEEAGVLTVTAAMDGDGSFELYEDDGISNDYLKGEYFLTQIGIHSGEGILSFGTKGNYVSRFTKTRLTLCGYRAAPKNVIAGGEEIRRYIYKPEFDIAESGWYYDPAKGTVLVKLPALNNGYKVKVSRDPVDLIGM